MKHLMELVSSDGRTAVAIYPNRKEVRKAKDLLLTFPGVIVGPSAVRLPLGGRIILKSLEGLEQHSLMGLDATVHFMNGCRGDAGFELLALADHLTERYVHLQEARRTGLRNRRKV